MALVLLSDHRTDAPRPGGRKRPRGGGVHQFRPRLFAFGPGCPARHWPGAGTGPGHYLESELARCADTRSELMVRVRAGQRDAVDRRPGRCGRASLARWPGGGTSAACRCRPAGRHLAQRHHRLPPRSLGRGGRGRRETGVAVEDLDQGWLLCSAHATAVYANAAAAGGSRRPRTRRPLPAMPARISIRAAQPGERASRPGLRRR